MCCEKIEVMCQDRSGTRRVRCCGEAGVFVEDLSVHEKKDIIARMGCCEEL